MIGGVTSFLTNPTLSTVAQSTTAAVTLETTMKALGRPTFILADKKLDDQTKKYATAKEFLYQTTCLATYFFVVVPLFKNGGFKLAKKMMQDEPGFKLFDSAQQFLDYKHLASMKKNERLLELSKKRVSKKFSETVRKELSKDTPEAFDVVKGTIELGNIVGSVLGLAIFAPQVSHVIVHPALKMMGLEKNKNKSQNDKSINLKA